MARSLFRYLLALLSLCVLAALSRPHRFLEAIVPLPSCSDCVSRANILAPGIGIDLTPSYATAAIRYHNGSVVNLGRVDASEEYVDLISRLSPETSKEPHCTLNLWDQIRCSLTQARRQLNKIRGLPATADIGIIANMILQLREILDKKLGKGVVDRAIPVVPELAGLYWEDLEDAMEYAGLVPLETHKHIGSIVSEMSAAFAGMGYGLCDHYSDWVKCKDEEADMPFSHILALGFSHESFSATYDYTQSAFSSIPETALTQPDLGLNHLPESQDSHQIYWNKIRLAILSVGRTAQRPLTDLLLYGEDAGNSKFLEIVQEAARVLISEGLANISFETLEHLHNTFDPMYIAARGAAEFAKRAQESPPSCIEPPRCEGIRNATTVYVEGQVKEL